MITTPGTIPTVASRSPGTVQPTMSKIRRAPCLMTTCAVRLLPGVAHSELQVCFTPGEDCTGLITAEINAAKSQILVQAYTFTPTQIAGALPKAVKRGVEVRAILDRTNEQTRYGIAQYLRLAGIPVLIDDRVAIAHSKLLLIDGRRRQLQLHEGGAGS